MVKRLQSDQKKVKMQPFGQKFVQKNDQKKIDL